VCSQKDSAFLMDFEALLNESKDLEKELETLESKISDIVRDN